MPDLLPFIILGAISGAVYGLAGVGLVLTYKTSGILNFAHGAVAAIGAFSFYALHVRGGVAWPVAAAICVLVVGPLVGLLFERLASAVSGAGLALQVASTVGVLLAVEAATMLIYPGSGGSLIVPIFLSQGEAFSISGASVPWAGLETLAIATLATAGLYGFFRYGRRGKAMRALVDSPALLDLSGTSAIGVRRLAWIIGITFATASGVLFAPLLPLDAVTLTFLVVQAFGAAAIGAFTSLPITFGGGLLLGVLSSLLTKWFLSGALAGLSPSLPFLLLFVLLLVLPRRYLVERAPVREVRALDTWRAPTQVQLVGAAIGLGVLLAVPAFAGFHLPAWTLALATAVIFLSLSLLVRTSGQVSLCVIAFAAIGAATLSHLTVDQGWPWFLALLAAGFVAVPVGAVLAIPAMRLSGLYLALATFGFGILLSYLFYPASYMFGTSGVGLREPRPDIPLLATTTDTGLYYFMLIAAAAVGLLVVGLNRSRLGRLLRAMADSPTALSTSGVSVNVTRMLVFCLSAFLASIGGALAGVASDVASASSYAPITSLTYVVLIVIIAGRAPWNALIAAVGLIVVPSYISGEETTSWLQLIFGLSAVAMAVGPSPSMPSAVRRAVDRRFRKAPDQRVQRLEPSAPAAVAPVAGTGLRIADVTVRFGGLLAVDRVSVCAPPGRITGLIGPNGAGKTTTFNACSGLVRPGEGSIVIDDRDVTAKSPAARARQGLARTYQQTRLFDSLTVAENVALGREGAMAGGAPVNHLAATRAQSATIRAATAAAVRLCGLSELAHEPVATLSTGQRRLVELARAIAGPARILLLDEPSAGLDRSETGRFGQILRRVIEERNLAILLVEHDMSLVMDVCEYIYVLDFGQLLFEGSTAEVRASPIVQAAYLGSEDVEELASRDDVGAVKADA